MPIHVIMVHGISGHTGGWSTPVREKIEELLPEEQFVFDEVCWVNDDTPIVDLRFDAPDTLGDMSALSSQKVADRIDQSIRTAEGKDQVWLIAHSLGTALSHEAVLRCNTKFDKIIFMGSPLWMRTSRGGSLLLRWHSVWARSSWLRKIFISQDFWVMPEGKDLTQKSKEYYSLAGVRDLVCGFSAFGSVPFAQTYRTQTRHKLEQYAETAAFRKVIIS